MPVAQQRNQYLKAHLSSAQKTIKQNGVVLSDLKLAEAAQNGDKQAQASLKAKFDSMEKEIKRGCEFIHKIKPGWDKNNMMLASFQGKAQHDPKDIAYHTTELAKAMQGYIGELRALKQAWEEHHRNKHSECEASHMLEVQLVISEPELEKENAALEIQLQAVREEVCESNEQLKKVLTNAVQDNNTYIVQLLQNRESLKLVEAARLALMQTNKARAESDQSIVDAGARFKEAAEHGECLPKLQWGIACLLSTNLRYDCDDLFWHHSMVHTECGYDPANVPAVGGGAAE